MGDPKKLRKKYKTPAHPWIRTAIEEEKVLVKDYGLVKKKEIQIATSFLKKYKNIAKKLIADPTKQGAVEKAQMMTKLRKLGLVSEAAELDNVLSLGLKDILDRRIQSQVYKKGLARSIKQARQFITHGHIGIGTKSITSPSCLITLDEESRLCFNEVSQLKNPEHPERVSIVKEIEKEKEAVKGRGKKKDLKAEKTEEIAVKTDLAAKNEMIVNEDEE